MGEDKAVKSKDKEVKSKEEDKEEAMGEDKEVKSKDNEGICCYKITKIDERGDIHAIGLDCTKSPWLTECIQAKWHLPKRNKKEATKVIDKATIIDVFESLGGNHQLMITQRDYIKAYQPPLFAPLPSS